jgi:hypothetical protein
VQGKKPIRRAEKMPILGISLVDLRLAGFFILTIKNEDKTAKTRRA